MSKEPLFFHTASRRRDVQRTFGLFEVWSYGLDEAAIYALERFRWQKRPKPINYVETEFNFDPQYHSTKASTSLKCSKEIWTYRGSGNRGCNIAIPYVIQAEWPVPVNVRNGLIALAIWKSAPQESRVLAVSQSPSPSVDFKCALSIFGIAVLSLIPALGQERASARALQYHDAPAGRTSICWTPGSCVVYPRPRIYEGGSNIERQRDSGAGGAAWY